MLGCALAFAQSTWSTIVRIVSTSPTRIAAAITVSITVSRRSTGMFGGASWSPVSACSYPAAHAPATPQATYGRLSSTVEPIACKRAHYFRARYHRDSPAICTLFVDDELPAVRQLIEVAVPAMHISEFATLGERDALTLLRRSRRALSDPAADMQAAEPLAR
jgi:hypothetical protein